MSAALPLLIEELAQAVAARAMEIIAEQKFVRQEDPLLKPSEVAKQLRVSERTVRNLVPKYLKRAPGLVVTRIRQSEVDKFGTSQK